MSNTDQNKKTIDFLSQVCELLIDRGICPDTVPLGEFVCILSDAHTDGRYNVGDIADCAFQWDAERKREEKEFSEWENEL